MSLVDFFDQGWRRDRAAIAYVGADAAYTFDEARRMSCRIGHALRRVELSDDAKVAVLSPNDPLAWICVLGIWRAGLAWVPLNPASHPADLGKLVDAFEVELLFVHPALVELCSTVLAGVDRKPRVVTLDLTPLEEWTAGLPDVPPLLTHDPERVVAVAPTGGTTGAPKGVVTTNRSMGVSIAHLMLALPYDAGDPIVDLVAAPMTHAAGMISLAATARGGRVVVIPRADATAIVDAVERHGVTQVFLPPTAIYRLLDLPGLMPDRLRSMRYLVYGAAPMSIERLRHGIELLGPVFVASYGQTEAYVSIAFLRPDEQFDVHGRPDPAKLASCGRPYPLVQVEIRDGGGRALATGESGEIVVSGDLVMSGYYRAPEKTREAIVDGWLHTGDIGHLDESGYLYITDRKRDLIISGGYNVYPSDVEQVLWSHPSVADCAVIGVPHDDWGEAVTAIVELRPGATAGEHELRAFARAALGGIRAPKSVIFVEELPRSANGKVLKKDLRERFGGA